MKKSFLSDNLRTRPLCAFSLLVFCSAVLAATMLAETNEVAQPVTQLKKFSLEELMEMEVTSVSKKPEKLTEVASAIQVITQEDIRRSGASSIPEALRLA